MIESLNLWLKFSLVISSKLFSLQILKYLLKIENNWKPDASTFTFRHLSQVFPFLTNPVQFWQMMKRSINLLWEIRRQKQNWNEKSNQERVRRQKCWGGGNDEKDLKLLREKNMKIFILILISFCWTELKLKGFKNKNGKCDLQSWILPIYFSWKWRRVFRHSHKVTRRILRN